MKFRSNTKVRLVWLLLGLLAVVWLGTLKVASADTFQAASLVNIIDTSTWSPNAPDPAGIAWWSSRGHLLIVDSEVDEMPPYFTGSNVFEAETNGSLTATFSTLQPHNFSDEPTGVTVNPANDHLFISSDTTKRVYEMNLGGDNQPGTADDVITSFSTTAFGNNDPEDLAFWQGKLYISDGTGGKIYVVDSGANGVFDGVPPSGDDTRTNFDTKNLGVPDPEGIGINPDTGTLLMLGPGAPNTLFETTLTGTLVRRIDISFINPVWVAGVTVAPSSFDPGVNDIYIADRVVDNGDDSNENDGKVYEIHLENGAPPNLLANPGFEFDTNHDNKPDAWSTDAHFTRSTTAVHGGDFSGKHFANDNAGYTVKGTAYNISAGSSYTASAWVNIPPTNDSFSLKLDVNWQNANGNSISISAVKTYTSQTDNWDLATANLTAPNGATKAHLRMIVSSLKATLYVDDVVFRSVINSPPPTLTNTPVPPTLTNTPVPPTITDTPVPPTITDTPVPPTITDTPVPPTITDTPVPPTITDTPVPPTVTDTPTVPSNLLLNPGFELDADNNNRPDNWSSSPKFTRSNEQVHSGNFAGKQFDAANSDFTINQTVPNISAGATYHLSAWVNIPNTSDAFNLKIQVRWQNAGGSNLHTDTIKSYSGATNGWDLASGTVVAPPGASTALVRLNVTDLNATVFLDDIGFAP